MIDRRRYSVSGTAPVLLFPYEFYSVSDYKKKFSPSLIVLVPQLGVRYLIRSLHLALETLSFLLGSWVLLSLF